RGREGGSDGFRREAEAEFSRPLAVQLRRDELELGLAALADDLREHWVADQLADDDALKLVHAFDRRAVELDDQILRPQAGAVRGAALDHLHDLDAAAPAELTRETRRERSRPACDPEIGAAESTFRHQRGDDPARCRV